MGREFGRSGLREVLPILPAYSNSTLPLHLPNPYPDTDPTHISTQSSTHMDMARY